MSNGYAGRVSFAFGDSMFTRDPVWTALDQVHPNLVVSWTCDRGRAYELDRTEGGRATVELVDTDGVMDPTNPTSPYMSTLNQINPLTQVVLCRRDPVAAEWQPRFRGFVSDLNYTVDPSQKLTRVTVELVDLFEILGGIEMQPGEFGDTPPTDSQGQIFFGPAATMETRIVQVLGNAGIPTGYYVVFSGNVSLTGHAVYSPGESPLTVIQEAVDAEFPGVGNVYVDRIPNMAGCPRTAGMPVSTRPLSSARRGRSCGTGITGRLATSPPSRRSPARPRSCASSRSAGACRRSSTMRQRGRSGSRCRPRASVHPPTPKPLARW